MSRAEHNAILQLIWLAAVLLFVVVVCAVSCRSRYDPPPLNGTPEWQPSRNQWPQADGPDFNPCQTEFPKLTEL